MREGTRQHRIIIAKKCAKDPTVWRIRTIWNGSEEGRGGWGGEAKHLPNVVAVFRCLWPNKFAHKATFIKHKQSHCLFWYVRAWLRVCVWVCVWTGHKMFMSTLAGHCPLCYAVPVRPSSTSFTFTTPTPKSFSLSLSRSRSQAQSRSESLSDCCFDSPLLPPSLSLARWAPPTAIPSAYFFGQGPNQAAPRRVASGACASLLLSMICFWAHKMQANWIFSRCSPAPRSLSLPSFATFSGSTWRMLNYIIHIAHTARCVCVCVCGSNNMKLSSMCANKASIHGGKLINLSGQSRYIGQWHWKWARKCFLLFQFLPFCVGPNRIAQGINLFC